MIHRGVEVVDRHRKQIVRGVAVARDRRLVGREDAEGVVVVHPHRFGIRLEQQPVLRLAVGELLLRPFALDHQRALGGDEFQDLPLPLAVADSRRIGLHGDHADAGAAGFERDAHPVEGGGADQLDFALGHQPIVDVRCRQERRAGPQYVLRQPAAHALGRESRIELVLEVREREHLLRLVVERDIEVAGRHQLADDGMHRAVQLGQGVRGIGRFGNAVGGRLQMFGAASIGDVALRPPHPDQRAVLDEPHGVRDEDALVSRPVDFVVLLVVVPVAGHDERLRRLDVLGIALVEELGDELPHQLLGPLVAVHLRKHRVALGQDAAAVLRDHLLVEG